MERPASERLRDPSAPLAIRSYRESDLDGLYEICVATGLAGADASGVITDRRLLGELFVAPYVALEPERAFVVDDGTGAPGGYLVGAHDTRAFEAACESSWWPLLRERYPEGQETGAFDDLLVALIHQPILADDAVVREFPSHLHVDLLPPFQGRGLGTELMRRFLDSAAASGSRGVHVGVNVGNERAVEFYRRLGFDEVDADPVTRTFALRLPRTT